MVRLLRCAAPHQGLGDFPKVLKDRFSYLGRESPKRREPILLNFAFVYTNAMRSVHGAPAPAHAAAAAGNAPTQRPAAFGRQHGGWGLGAALRAATWGHQGLGSLACRLHFRSLWGLLPALPLVPRPEQARHGVGATGNNTQPASRICVSGKDAVIL